MSAYLGELVGTTVLIVLGGGVCAGVSLKKSLSHQAGWIVVTLGWGLGVALGAYAVGNISGAHLNPALTLALAFNGDFSWESVPGYMVAQIIGAFLGAVIVFVHYLPHWKETEDPGAKLGVFSTGPAIAHMLANMLSEIIATFMLVFGILAIGSNEFTEGLNPFVVGFLIVSIGLSLGGTTGYAINPARDFGPRLAHFLLPIPGKGDSNWKYAWIPIIGPLLGGSLGGLAYKALFIGEISPFLWFVLAFTAIVLIVIYMIDNLKRTKNLT